MVKPAGAEPPKIGESWRNVSEHVRESVTPKPAEHGADPLHAAVLRLLGRLDGKSVYEFESGSLARVLRQLGGEVTDLPKLARPGALFDAALLRGELGRVAPKLGTIARVLHPRGRLVLALAWKGEPGAFEELFKSLRGAGLRAVDAAEPPDALVLLCERTRRIRNKGTSG